MTMRATIQGKITELQSRIDELQKVLDAGGIWLDREPADAHAFIDAVVAKVIPAIAVDTSVLDIPPPPKP